MHIRKLRQALVQNLGVIHESLSAIYRRTYWKECTSEAAPLARQHRIAEQELRSTRGLHQALLLAPRQGRSAAVRAEVERLTRAAREIEEATAGWPVSKELSKLRNAVEQLSALARLA